MNNDFSTDDNAPSPTQSMLRGLSTAQFQQLGMNEIAYIKQIKQGVDQGFAVHAADGTLLTVQNALQNAVILTRQNDLIPVTVH